MVRLEHSSWHAGGLKNEQHCSAAVLMSPSLFCSWTTGRAQSSLHTLHCEVWTEPEPSHHWILSDLTQPLIHPRNSHCHYDETFPSVQTRVQTPHIALLTSQPAVTEANCCLCSCCASASEVNSSWTLFRRASQAVRVLVRRWFGDSHCSSVSFHWIKRDDRSSNTHLKAPAVIQQSSGLETLTVWRCKVKTAHLTLKNIWIFPQRAKLYSWILLATLSLLSKDSLLGLWGTDR